MKKKRKEEKGFTEKGKKKKKGRGDYFFCA